MSQNNTPKDPVLKNLPLKNSLSDGNTKNMRSKQLSASKNIKPQLLTQKHKPSTYLHVALPIPMRRIFDYISPNETQLSDSRNTPLQSNTSEHIISEQADTSTHIGKRVEVPFGHRTLIGIITGESVHSLYPQEKLKRAIAIIDATPSIPKELMTLLCWAADYYQHALGEVLFAALPPKLRRSQAQRRYTIYEHTTQGKGLPSTALSRSKKQQEIHQALLCEFFLSKQTLKSRKFSSAALKALIKKDIVIERSQSEQEFIKQHNQATRHNELLNEPPKPLNHEQFIAVSAVNHKAFTCYLLEGVTGSGKTEVYLHLIARTLSAGLQALVLIPEIGLTTQTVERFERRFKVHIAELHSGVSEAQRALNWQAAKSGEARIVIGTRLAALCPSQSLGIIIIDEEHDLSYKQHDGFRYSARDLCIYRAKMNKIPIILGSATPSLESLNHAKHHRYTYLQLRLRAANAQEPHIQLLDIRNQPCKGGLAQQSMDAIQQAVNRGHQALVFINARGFAPILLCHSCGWTAQCHHCDNRLTLHLQPYGLHCHHCDRKYKALSRCPNCDSAELHSNGFGTEQTEKELSEQFPKTRVLRIDRDSTSRKNALAEQLEIIKQGAPCILVGTQMLAKGHHFPNLALVVILDADKGLFSSDFRGPERMGQQIIQVAGRAGREHIKGDVILQTHRPEHPLLNILINEGYPSFARQILNERQACQLPPFTYMALIRSNACDAHKAKTLLQALRQWGIDNQEHLPKHTVLGPLAAPIERIKNQYRFQLQINAAQRAHIKILVMHLLSQIDKNPISKHVRWSVDIDPIDLS